MKILNLTIIAFTAFTLFNSCSGGSTPTVPVSSYAGGWAGTYKGASDSGVININVLGDGSVNGGTISTITTLGFYSMFSGSVNSSGQFHAISGTAGPAFTYSGTMMPTTVNGTWSRTNNGATSFGTWTAVKQ